MTLSVSVATSSDKLADLVTSLKDAWRQGDPPDAARALRENPDLLRHRTLVVDLAYEEYCLLDEAGCPPEPEEFCRRLPAFRSHVREVIRGHRELADHPELFAQTNVVWPEAGDCFEDHIIVRELGRGAFARAYLATDPEAGDRQVVLKLSQTASAEARTLGPRIHPHVVGVLWARQAAGMHCLCMPYVGSATLADVVEVAHGSGRTQTPRSAQAILSGLDTVVDPASELSPLLTGQEPFSDAVAAIGVRLAQALAYLGRSGVTHGDLKPSNVILGPGGHPYLIDFNLSTGLNESFRRCGGTLPYMAPERLQQLLGDRGNDIPLAAGDIYSLGVVLFETLTGQVPFQAKGPPIPELVAEELLFLQQQGVPGFRPGNGTVPRSLAGLVERCLATNPGARPTADVLARELNRHLHRRVRRAKAMTVVGAAIMGVGLSGWQLLAGPSTTPLPQPEATRPAQTAAVPTTPTTAEEFFDRGVQFLKAGDTTAASTDFATSNRKHRSGRTTAFHAYCESRGAHSDAAAQLYEDAIKKQGYGPAWVHNNRAACLIKLRSPENLREAIRETTEALALKPDLQAALFNRAVARYHLNIDKSYNLADDACVADLNAVLKDGPHGADLCFKAALILAASAASDEEQLARAVTYAREAVLCGKTFKQLEDDPVLKRHLGGRKDFRDLASLPTQKPSQSPVVLDVIDPLTQ